MFSNKPWYEYSGSHFNLKESDFICSEKEINDFLSFYRKVIDLISGDYNFIKREFPFFDFCEFNYEDESKMDKYILELLSFSKEIYAIPIIFSYDDLNCVLFEFNPSAVAKVNSTLNDYNRIFGSMISDYSGAFLIAPIDFSYVVIVKNGHYILRFLRKKYI